jgi:hypothetical protein
MFKKGCPVGGKLSLSKDFKHRIRIKRCVEIQQKKNAENICKIGTYVVVRSERFDYANRTLPKKNTEYTNKTREF